MPTLKGFSTTDPDAFKKVNAELKKEGKALAGFNAKNWKSEKNSDCVVGGKKL